MQRRGPRSPQKTADRRVLLKLLRAVRLEAGLRQEDLAKAIKRKQAYVSKYELGERRLDLLELTAICDVVGIKLSTFVKRFEEGRTRAEGESLPAKIKGGGDKAAGPAGAGAWADQRRATIGSPKSGKKGSTGQ